MPEPTTPSRAALLGVAAVSRGLRALGPLRGDIANVIGTYWYARELEEQRMRTAANHRRCNPALSPAEARRLARRSYREYVAMILDSIWAESQNPSAVMRHVHVRGRAQLDRTRDGAVFAISHFGNWDIAATAAVALGVRITTVMGPVISPFLSSLVAWSREHKGLELYSPERAARGLIRALRARRVVSLMADVPEAGPTVVVQYCGGPVRFSSVPARLAMAERKPLMPVACWRAGSGWVLEIHPAVPIQPGDDETDVTARVAKVLEPTVLRHPEQWYPFHDVYCDV